MAGQPAPRKKREKNRAHMGVTQREKREKLAHVERTIAQRGWSPRIVAEIAEKFGVCNRTVYKWRLQVLEEIADNQRGIDRELARAEYLIRIQDHTRAARAQWSRVSWSIGERWT